MNASVIDVFEFCRLAEHREGTLAGAELPRLAEEAVDGNPVLSWSLQGDVNQYGHARVTMKVAGGVTLVCQRCMKPVEQKIDSMQVLVFAQSDAEADEIEALLDDESIDVVVAQKFMKVVDLIEDEVLLSLPSSPRHEVCPDRDAATLLEEVRKPSPFDVLKGLKQ